jgi:hypothetical protein
MAKKKAKRNGGRRHPQVSKLDVSHLLPGLEGIFQALAALIKNADPREPETFKASLKSLFEQGTQHYIEKELRQRPGFSDLSGLAVS